jgi:hypothetical protein
MASTLKEIVMAATNNSSRSRSPAERTPNMFPVTVPRQRLMGNECWSATAG